MNPTKTKKKKTQSEASPDVSKPETKSATPAASRRVRLDETNAKLSYANFFNVSSTREETALMFGMVQVSPTAGQEVAIQVSDRVVISPHAAKRLHTMLGHVLSQYETRFGPLPEIAPPR